MSVRFAKQKRKVKGADFSALRSFIEKKNGVAWTSGADLRQMILSDEALAVASPQRPLPKC